MSWRPAPCSTRRSGAGSHSGCSRTNDTTGEAAGRHLVMLRDGAMAAGCLFDPKLISETFLNGVEGLLRTLTTDTADSSNQD